jgi:hypothetical protein
VGPEQKAQQDPIRRVDFDSRQEMFRAEVSGSAEKAYSKQKEIRFRYVCAPDNQWKAERIEDSEDYRAILTIPGHMSPPEGSDVESVFDLYNDFFREAEKAYARFQDYRALQSEIPHDRTALRLAVQQGLVVLYYVRALSDIHEGITKLGCSVHYMKKPIKTLDGVLEDVSQGQLPGLMSVLRQSVDQWTYNLVQLEFDILLGRDVGPQCKQWWDPLTTGDNVYDTPILTWCGYGFARLGQREDALNYWRKAGQTVHDPQMANYALMAVRDIEKLGRDATKVRKSKRDE